MPNPQENKSLCLISVGFIVDDDNQAIAVKQKIAAAVVDIPEATMDFRIRSGRPPIPRSSGE